MREKHYIENRLRDLHDSLKHSNYLHLHRDLRRGRGRKCIWRNNSSKFPKSRKGNIQIQEAQRTPNKINPRRLTPRHIGIKLTNSKEFKGCKKMCIHRETPLRLLDFVGQMGVASYIQSAERETCSQEYFISSKTIIQDRRKKEFPRSNLQESVTTKLTVEERWKGTLFNGKIRESMKKYKKNKGCKLRYHTPKTWKGGEE